MKKKRTIIISIIFILLAIFFYPYIFFRNRPVHNIVNTVERLTNLPIPKDPIKLTYDFNREIFKEGIKSQTKGSYIYCGSDNSMTLFNTNSQSFLIYSDNTWYDLTDVYIDKVGNMNINSRINEEIFSTIRIDKDYSILAINPLFGIYQPGQHIFFNTKIDYKDGKVFKIHPSGAEFGYDDKGRVNLIKSHYGEYSFKDYKYFKNIDMEIPTKIIFKTYDSFMKKGKLQNELFKKEIVTLVDTKKASKLDIKWFNMKRPPFEISIYDFRDVNSNSRFKYNPKMGTVDEQSRKHLEEKKEDDKNIFDKSNIIKILSLLVIVIILYFVVVNIKKNKKNNK